MPIRRGGVAAKFGLDLKPWLTKISRARDSPALTSWACARSTARTRDWMRVQVTDLALSTVEEPTRVKFAVTSLATARPGGWRRCRGSRDVRDDKVRHTSCSGTHRCGRRFHLGRGETARMPIIKRIVAAKRSRRTLVLDPADGPRAILANENWAKTDEIRGCRGPSTKRRIGPRRKAAHALCHVFTERPIYRPEEPVHIKGYRARLSRWRADLRERRAGTVVVTGPANQEWRDPR